MSDMQVNLNIFIVNTRVPNPYIQDFTFYIFVLRKSFENKAGFAMELKKNHKGPNSIKKARLETF